MAVIGSQEDQNHKRDLFGEENMPTATEDLFHYLKGEFQSGEPFRLTTRQPDATGRQLSERMVSRLEVQNAIGRLRYRQRRVMELLYLEGCSNQDAARQLNISDRTLQAERSAALDAMTEMIYEWQD